MTAGARPCPLCATARATVLLTAGPRRMVRCDACSLVYRDPLPTPAPPPATPGPDADVVRREERVARRRSREFRRLLATAGPPGRLLDVGTGFGFFLGLASEAGWSAVGVDPDAGAARYARSRLGVDARAGSLEAQAFPAASFDLVTFWNVLECIPEPLATLHAARRLVRPGGRIFVRTQNLAWQAWSFRVTEAAKRLGLRRRLEGAPHLTFIFNAISFSRATLGRALTSAGFEVVSVGNSPPIPGDPYLGLAAPGELALALAKHAVWGVAEAVALASAGRWLVAPSLAAWGRVPA
ncbi:MAG: hypothetical protein A3I17_09685 [Candidatus Rokubacteria bacterium RIFCSPLOWO2_02_FULL_72_37]|nr:MAG: hypothetical protein A3I17_09685 [Candidatus Rokubacteria bacterium RIFCSPLOWO2_02_FULL_72_37]